MIDEMIVHQFSHNTKHYSYCFERDELTAHGVRVETFRMMAAKIGGEICARYKTKVKEEGLLVKRLPCCTRLLSDQQHSQVLSQSHP
jgi:hypothetical protein